MGSFYIHVHDGTVASEGQLVDAEIVESVDDITLPWHRINTPSDTSTLWYVALRKQEKGIWLGTMTFRHCDHHSLLLTQGWAEVPQDEIGALAD